MIEYTHVSTFVLISGKEVQQLITGSASSAKNKSIVLNHKKDKHKNICLKQPETKVVLNPDQTILKLLCSPGFLLL